MEHVMVDLETMGLRPDAAIVSIGACHFDEGAVHRTFEMPVSLSDCVENGLTTDDSTVEWWSKQSAEARAAWQTADAAKLLEALVEFNRWLLSVVAKPEYLCVWGNGADFDVVLMTSAYRAVRADPPWKFWNVRCHRTVKNLFPLTEMPTKRGVAHRSVDDAVNQAVHLQRICLVHGFKLA